MTSLLVSVALRKESVDRNLWWGVRKAVGSLVALRKESVDRNINDFISIHIDFSSLSARRAWIEIRLCDYCERTGVSLSARRAWIEIMRQMPLTRFCRVALRKESVDRNIYVSHELPFNRRRSPQGERG